MISQISNYIGKFTYHFKAKAEMHTRRDGVRRCVYTKTILVSKPSNGEENCCYNKGPSPALFDDLEG